MKKLIVLTVATLFIMSCDMPTAEEQTPTTDTTTVTVEDTTCVDTTCIEEVVAPTGTTGTTGEVK